MLAAAVGRVASRGHPPPRGWLYLDVLVWQRWDGAFVPSSPASATCLFFPQPVDFPCSIPGGVRWSPPAVLTQCPPPGSGPDLTPLLVLFRVILNSAENRDLGGNARCRALLR